MPGADSTLTTLLGAQDTFWMPALVLGGLYGVRYFVFAGIAFAASGRSAAGLRRRLQAATPSAAQMCREIGYSVVAVAIFGVIGGLLAWSGALPHTQIYHDFGRHGVAWFAASILFALVLHDAWFYWTHRLLHLRRVFPVMHRIHHLSTNPTPWTAYAFHPLESLVQALGGVFVVFVLPMHVLAIVAFQTLSTAVNVYGHTGYEYYPPGWSRHPLGRWINTSVAHNAHHQTARHNYGLYFLWWDRWMGTIDPAYDKRYDLARPAGAPARHRA